MDLEQGSSAHAGLGIIPLGDVCRENENDARANPQARGRERARLRQRDEMHRERGDQKQG